MTLAEDVAALQTRLADAERQRARAEGARDSAKAAFVAAREELARQFGVNTVEEAADLLDQMRADLSAVVADMTTKLDQIGLP